MMQTPYCQCGQESLELAQQAHSERVYQGHSASTSPLWWECPKLAGTSPGLSSILAIKSSHFNSRPCQCHCHLDSHHWSVHLNSDHFLHVSSMNEWMYSFNLQSTMSVLCYIQNLISWALWKPLGYYRDWKEVGREMAASPAEGKVVMPRQHLPYTPETWVPTPLCTVLQSYL